MGGISILAVSREHWMVYWVVLNDLQYGTRQSQAFGLSYVRISALDYNFVDCNQST